MVTDLFPDAEIAKNRIQNILDVDPAGQPAHILGRRAQRFRHQFQMIRRLRGGAQQILDA